MEMLNSDTENNPLVSVTGLPYLCNTTTHRVNKRHSIGTAFRVRFNFVNPSLIFTLRSSEIGSSSEMRWWSVTRILREKNDSGELWKQIWCTLMLRLHTAINRADFVSWWMWFNGSPTKAHRHFLTNAFCYLLTYITCTRIRNRPD